MSGGITHRWYTKYVEETGEVDHYQLDSTDLLTGTTISHRVSAINETFETRFHGLREIIELQNATELKMSRI